MQGIVIKPSGNRDKPNVLTKQLSSLYCVMMVITNIYLENTGCRCLNQMFNNPLQNIKPILNVIKRSNDGDQHVSFLSAIFKFDRKLVCETLFQTVQILSILVICIIQFVKSPSSLRPNFVIFCNQLKWLLKPVLALKCFYFRRINDTEPTYT